MPKRALVLDIDFTLIHLERVPGAIEVPGRTRSAWLAPRTVEALGELQTDWEIVLATARSWNGTRWVVEGLGERGVDVKSVVIEDGACLGKIGQLEAFAPNFDATELRDSLRVENDWPTFEWQLDFESCAVARCETPDGAAQLLELFAEQAKLKRFNPRFYRDGRKVYILPREADKWSALQRLLGERAARAAGVGDGENDLVWLPNVAHPATFGDASAALVEAVRARGGLVGAARGHRAIAELLNALNKNLAEPHGG